MSTPNPFIDYDYKSLKKFYRSIRTHLSDDEKNSLDNLFIKLEASYRKLKQLIKRIEAWEDANDRDFISKPTTREP